MALSAFGRAWAAPPAFYCLPMDHSEAQEAAGQSDLKYERIRLVGSGTFGAAWLVRSRRSGKQYVMKDVSVACMSAKERGQALTEVKILRDLKHPAIVKYHEAFCVDGTLHICMEYAAGGDLCTRIKHQRGTLFEESTVVAWLGQIASALAFIHGKSILHRDLKSQNIFLSHRNAIKLGDFGIAKLLTSTDHASTMVGTPFYLSPEICLNKPYNHKSDMWALGCVLFELLTLKHAFSAPNINGLIVKIIKGVYPPPSPTYSTSLTTGLSHLLSVDPAQRPSARDVLSWPWIVAHATPKALQCEQAPAHKMEAIADPDLGVIVHDQTFFAHGADAQPAAYCTPAPQASPAPAITPLIPSSPLHVPASTSRDLPPPPVPYPTSIPAPIYSAPSQSLSEAPASAQAQLPPQKFDPPPPFWRVRAAALIQTSQQSVREPQPGPIPGTPAPLITPITPLTDEPIAARETSPDSGHGDPADGARSSSASPFSAPSPPPAFKCDAPADECHSHKDGSGSVLPTEPRALASADVCAMARLMLGRGATTAGERREERETSTDGLGVGASVDDDSPFLRLEALQEFVEARLGVDLFLAVYRSLAAMTADSEEDVVMQRAEQLLGPRHGYLLPVLLQLVSGEAQHYR